MQQPNYLQLGDSITIISTARKISLKELEPAINLFESWGLQVNLGGNLFLEHHQFAGDEERRAEDLQNALDDKNCKVIICARGGYGTVQLIDKIDFSKFVENPKWIVGYSDVTVLHNHINQNFNIETLHATMPINIESSIEEEVTGQLRAALFGEELSFDFMVGTESIFPSKEVSAPIVGGNLSILYSLTGTESQISTEGKFLFIEDLDEYLYHIDRMMRNLIRAGLLNGCKGIFVGGMNDMNDNTIPYGATANEIILENTRDLGISVVFGLPAGHIKRNLPLIMNRNATLKIRDNRAKLSFDGRT